jgi:serine/threonine protein kinase
MCLPFVLPGVANRDIKLDNILLDRSVHGKADWPILKICDWGYAKHDAKSIAKSRVVSACNVISSCVQLAGACAACACAVFVLCTACYILLCRPGLR